MASRHSLARQLRSLEERLLDPMVRKSTAAVGALLTRDFSEVAASGRVYDRSQILAALQAAPSCRMTLSGFKAALLAPNVALTTFRLVKHDVPGRRTILSLRSSLWRRVKSRWRMAFHQGTPAARKPRTP